MGVSPQTLPGNVSLKDQARLTGIAKLWKTRDLPTKEGLSLPAMTRATKNRRIKALYLMESNPLEHWMHADQREQASQGGRVCRGSRLLSH